MTNQNSQTSLFENVFRLLILLLIVVWCLLIMYPFVTIILWSTILAMALYPLHKLVSEKLGNRPKLASAIIVSTIILILVIPVGFLIDSLVGEVKELKTSFNEGALKLPPPNAKVYEWPVVGKPIYGVWKSAYENMEQTIITYQDQLTKVGGKLVKGIVGATGGIIQILIALIIAGVLLVFNGMGESIRKFVRKLAGINGDEIVDVMMKTVTKVVKGVMGVALILAILNAILFLLIGVPFAGIWTLIIFVLAVLQLPIIFVTVPVIIYIFIHFDTVPAVIWTVLLLLVGLSDNILRPILLGKGAPVPMLVIFVGVIGGFILSGFLGLFTGAIVMSVGYKLFMWWLNETKESVPAN